MECKRQVIKSRDRVRIPAILIFILLSCRAFSQNYVDYQRIINKVDEDVRNGEYGSAMERLDYLYKNFDFIYSRHCFKALQICCTSRDTVNAPKWLEKSFMQGIPIWMIRTNELTSRVFTYSTTQSTLKQYDSLRRIYTGSIHQDLRNKIDSLYEIDQRFTRKVNDGFILFRNTYHELKWVNNNKKQFKILTDLMDKHGWPGERLIGLPKYVEDSAQSVNRFRFYGPVLQETYAYIMLIHYYSNPRPGINQKLLENVVSGNLPPYQYGAINDFMARWGKKKYGDFTYYNVWHTDPDSSNETETEERRKAIGLNSYEQQNQNRLMMRERRKSHTANSEIILE